MSSFYLLFLFTKMAGTLIRTGLNRVNGRLSYPPQSHAVGSFRGRYPATAVVARKEKSRLRRRSSRLIVSSIYTSLAGFPSIRQTTLCHRDFCGRGGHSMERPTVVEHDFATNFGANLKNVSISICFFTARSVLRKVLFWRCL